MKKLIQFCTIFMIFTSTTIFSALTSLFEQHTTRIMGILNNPKFPTNASLPDKNINFIAPDYPEDMYLYCYYPFRNNQGMNHNQSQRFEISKNNHFKITLLKPINTQRPIFLFLVPRESVEQYISELKNVTPLLDGLHNSDAVDYHYSPEEYKKVSDAQKILKNEFMLIADIDFEKISDDDTIHLPEYKPNISTPKTLPSHPSTVEPTTKTFHLTEGTGRVLTLSIPEQEIKLGVNFSN